MSGAPGPVRDPWARLRAATPARIGLGHVGTAPSLASVLDFQLSHARARDAIHTPLDLDELRTGLAPLQILEVASRAPSRADYLRRPDLGRRLDEGSAAALPRLDCDLVFVIGDGLSATGVARQAAAVVQSAAARLQGWKIGPVVIARQARVALGDEIGERMGASIAAVLIGERPGLSVSDSLGIYVTHAPCIGRRDSQRNCISNVHRTGGLAPDRAAAQLVWLLEESRRRGLSGIALKPPHGLDRLAEG